MADSNEHPMDETLEDESRAEAELDNTSPDEESGYTQDDTEKEESQDIPKTRSWRKGWMKKKEGTEPVEGESAPTTTKKVVVKSDLKTECNSFGAGLLNFCTFGLVSSGETVIVTEEVEVEGEQPISAEKIVADLAVSEAQLTMIDEETAMTSSPSMPSFNPRAKSIMSVHSVHSEGQSEGDADSTSVGSMLSKIIKKQKRDTLVFKVVGITIFLIMSALFITGGIMFKRNGW